jgi:hypothetical protein
MKRFFALALVLALIALGLPTASFAAAPRQGSGTISGIAKDAGGTALSGVTVRCRNTGTGAIAGTTTSNASGAFTFSNLGPASYVIEIVDSTGKVIATSATLTLTASQMSITGVAIATSAAAGGGAAAAAGGGSFFTSTAGILILAAAGAGTVGIIVATRSDSSPSK